MKTGFRFLPLLQLGLLAVAFLLLTLGSTRPTDLTADEDCCQTGNDVLGLVLDRCNRATPQARSEQPPVAAIITCMDPRINMDCLCGGQFWRYDVLRLPGAVLPEVVVESARLAVEKHHVKLIMVVCHTDCAMQKVARGPDDPRFATLQRHCRDFDIEFRALSSDPVLRKSGVVIVLAEYDLEADRDATRDRLKVLRRYPER